MDTENGSQQEFNDATAHCGDTGVSTVLVGEASSSVPLSNRRTEVGENWDGVLWSDVVVNDSGCLVSIAGVRDSDLKAKELRRICSVLKVRGLKNVKREAIVEGLLLMHKNREA